MYITVSLFIYRNSSLIKPQTGVQRVISYVSTYWSSSCWRIWTQFNESSSGWLMHNGRKRIERHCACDRADKRASNGTWEVIGSVVWTYYGAMLFFNPIFASSHMYPENPSRVHPETYMLNCMHGAATFHIWRFIYSSLMYIWKVTVTLRVIRSGASACVIYKGSLAVYLQPWHMFGKNTRQASIYILHMHIVFSIGKHHQLHMRTTRNPASCPGKIIIRSPPSKYCT